MAYEDPRAAGDGSLADLADVATQARRYLLEPADHSWQEVMAALQRAFGDGETDDLVHAFEIRVRSNKRP